MNQPTTIIRRSACHLTDKPWKERLCDTLERIGAPPPVFDFRTTEDPDPNRYADLKAPPMKMSEATDRRRRQVHVSKASPRIPSVPAKMIPFREVCDTVGILPLYLEKIVRSGAIKGCHRARLASLSSTEAYMATRP